MSTNHDSDKHHRHSMRLQGYDYTREGAYFVTVGMRDRACLFGDISDGKMILNEAGMMAEKHWRDIPAHFPHIELDEFVVMPNHVHGIIVINCRGTACRAPTAERFGKPVAGSVPTIIRSFKSAVTKWMRQNTPVYNVWQRNYYEHIIRDDASLNLIRQYIMDNPSRWAEDEENPARELSSAREVRQDGSKYPVFDLPQELFNAV
ncbi:MAG: transposase [Dehalococcoidia bacterium]|jgi:REP element-mobilizing transposase RayT